MKNIPSALLTHWPQVITLLVILGFCTYWLQQYFITTSSQIPATLEQELHRRTTTTQKASPLDKTIGSTSPIASPDITNHQPIEDKGITLPENNDALEVSTSDHQRYSFVSEVENSNVIGDEISIKAWASKTWFEAADSRSNPLSEKHLQELKVDVKEILLNQFNNQPTASLLQNIGLKPQDQITHINGIESGFISNDADMMDSVLAGVSLIIELDRDGQYMKYTFEAE